MGLDICAKGLPFTCRIGYLRYGYIMRQLALVVYGPEMADLYGDFRHEWTQVDHDFWNAHSDGDLDILLWHSDCDGKFTPHECKKVYRAINGINISPEWANEKLDELKQAFAHCAKRRVNLYYC